MLGLASFVVEDDRQRQAPEPNPLAATVNGSGAEPGRVPKGKVIRLAGEDWSIILGCSCPTAMM